MPTPEFCAERAQPILERHNQAAAEAIDGLLDHVIGIDVHPVAAHLARATWTLAARDVLEGAVRQRPHVGSV